MGVSFDNAIAPAELESGHVILKQGRFVVIEVHGGAGLTVFQMFDDAEFAPHDAVCGVLHAIGLQRLYSERSTQPVHGFVTLVDGELRTVLRYLGDHPPLPARPEPVPLLDRGLLVDLNRQIVDARTIGVLDQLERGIWWSYDADPRNWEGLQWLRESIRAKRATLEVSAHAL